MRVRLAAGMAFVVMLLAGCNLGDVAGAVPTTGDTSGDTTAAQRFLPTVAGYTITEANSISGALSGVTGGALTITGDPLIGGAIAAIDGLIQCYNSVGAAAARIYVRDDAANAALNGATPSFGVMAVLNGDRVVNNFLPCALGQVNAMSAQAAPEPEICSNNGSFVVENETLYYIYAATTQELCSAFQASVPAQ